MTERYFASLYIILLIMSGEDPIIKKSIKLILVNIIYMIIGIGITS